MQESIKIDKELNDIITKHSLLKHSGFVEYMKQVELFVDYKDEQISTLIQSPLLPENISILNALIAERNALRSLVFLREELEDSLNPSEETLNTYEE